MDHTPTPWMLCPTFGEVIRNETNAICREPNNPENGKNWKADAAFIVRAVNSHEALVKALKAVLPHIVNDSPGGCTGKYHETCAHCGAIRSARKALQQAEGK